MHNKFFIDFFSLVDAMLFFGQEGDVFAFAMCARKLITPAENSSSVGKRMWGWKSKKSKVKRKFLIVLQVQINRVNNFVRVCPNYKHGFTCTIDLICLMKFVCTPSIQKQ